MWWGAPGPEPARGFFRGQACQKIFLTAEYRSSACPESAWSARLPINNCRDQGTVRTAIRHGGFILMAKKCRARSTLTIDVPTLLKRRIKAFAGARRNTESGSGSRRGEGIGGI